MSRTEYQIPIQYGISWQGSQASLPEQKAVETDMLEAIIGLARVYGATNVEVQDIVDAPDGNGKVITLSSEGPLDIRELEASVRRALDQTTENGE